MRTSGTAAIAVFTDVTCAAVFSSRSTCFSYSALKSFCRQSGMRASANVAIADSALAVEPYTLTELVTFDWPCSKFGDFARGFRRFALLNARNGLHDTTLAAAASSAASDVFARAL